MSPNEYKQKFEWSSAEARVDDLLKRQFKTDWTGSCVMKPRSCLKEQIEMDDDIPVEDGDEQMPSGGAL